MPPTNYIYTSGPVSGSEAVALKSLSEKLTLRGEPFVIFSNVLLPKRQIDFIVVTEQRGAHLELKHFVGPIEGDKFGPWYNLSTTGSRISRVPSEGQNPREQAIGAKYAISDEMQAFAPLAKGDKHFRHFESAVCIFPQNDPKSKLAPGSGREHPRFLPQESAPARVKRLLGIGLKNWSRLDLGDLGDERYFGNPFQTVCGVLGRVGDEESVSVLEGFTQDTKKGGPAIEAIRSIKRRLQQ